MAIAADFIVSYRRMPGDRIFYPMGFDDNGLPTERYVVLGGTARVPLFGHEVPIRTDESVDLAFGTGLMMVCTFGDREDVVKWRRDGRRCGWSSPAMAG
jgi:valyl-tRNA synthetase